MSPIVIHYHMDDSTCPWLAYLHTHTPTVSNLAPATRHPSSYSVHSLSSLTAARFPRPTWQLPWCGAVFIFPGLWVALGGGCEFAAWESLDLRPSLVCSLQAALWVISPSPSRGAWEFTYWGDWAFTAAGTHCWWGSSPSFAARCASLTVPFLHDPSP